MIIIRPGKLQFLRLFVRAPCRQLPGVLEQLELTCYIIETTGQTTAEYNEKQNNNLGDDSISGSP